MVPFSENRYVGIINTEKVKTCTYLDDGTGSSVSNSSTISP